MEKLITLKMKKIKLINQQIPHKFLRLDPSLVSLQQHLEEVTEEETISYHRMYIFTHMERRYKI